MTDPICGLVAPSRKAHAVDAHEQDDPHEQDPIEIALARTVSVGVAAITARLASVEGGNADLAGLDWETLFLELRALRPNPGMDRWWNSVIVNTIIHAIAPLERRLLALEASHGSGTV